MIFKMVLNLNQREFIYPVQLNNLGGAESSDVPQKYSFTTNLAKDLSAYIRGSSPIVLDEWTEAYHLPGWYSEQTDNEKLIHDYISGKSEKN
ncbi:hypothetical protein MXB_4004 [Myxobolus squamalis]|nr:hypothetical protein MXB_4004 [Myxobolus squamalis]